MNVTHTFKNLWDFKRERDETLQATVCQTFIFKSSLFMYLPENPPLAKLMYW